MRPTYDDNYQAGTETEAQALYRVEDVWRCKLIKLPRYSVADRIAIRNDSLIAIFEVKGRNISRGKYDTYEIGKRKIDSLQVLSGMLKVPANLVVQWEDGLGWIHLSSVNPVGERFGGRDDRGDPLDREEVYCYDVGDFNWIWTGGYSNVE